MEKGILGRRTGPVPRHGRSGGGGTAVRVCYNAP